MTKISQLADVGANLASDDEFVIRDVSDNATPNKKVTADGFVNYVINQGAASGFTQIAAGTGPLSRVRTVFSGSTGSVLFETTASGSISEVCRVTDDGFFRTAPSAGGIQFNGDTAATNALDDYEEGTWTPTISFGGSSSGITYSVFTNGHYVKIGKMVWIRFTLDLTNKGSATGNLALAGLPFVSSVESYGAGRIYNGIAFNPAAFITFEVQQSASTLFVRTTTSGALAASWSDANFTNTSSFNASVVYRVS
jgi:hypothetical protein